MSSNGFMGVKQGVEEQMRLRAEAQLGNAAQVDSALLPARERERAERLTAAIKRRQSPPGMLGLPKLLDERRLEHGVTDAAFGIQASFNTVFVLQVSYQEGDTYEDSKIILTETTKKVERNRAPIGIIISAGLGALDFLRSNGIDLGHKVAFVHSAPYHIRYDVVAGEDRHLIVLESGQIRGSFDLAQNLRKRTVRIIQNPAAADRVEHILIDENGKPVMPQMAVES